ncbi:MAG: PocR ligand-binding domain-containing protein [Clostridia bacterium]|nr:PocR ligand-binding domain-containing protein [Clostridia bacterium]
MNKEKIISVLKELHTISGFRISLHNTSFEEIAAYPESKQSFCAYLHAHSESEYKKCVECDKNACEKVLASGETLIYKCHHGLIEAISPLYNFGALTGFLMMGQVREYGDGIDNMILALARLGKRDFDAISMCADMPSVKPEMVSSYVNIMTICARYLTLSNAVTGAKPTVSELVMQYICENYTEHITVKDICDAVGYSKSTVLSQFKRDYLITVNAYLNNMRLEQAKKMLENNNVSVNEVALMCGFSDQSYFSKVFSGKYGITPTDYRKDEKK